MKVLIVTVGLSAITNDDIGKVGMSSNITLRGEVESYMTSSRQQIKYWGDLLDRLVEAHKKFWKQPPSDVAASDKRKQTSAELVSTHLLRKSFSPDEVYLLSSDTDEGWLATMINQRVMLELWGFRVRAERIEGLDHKMEGVTARLLDCFNNYMRLNASGPAGPPPAAPGDEVVVNITGGYKGTLPELTLIAQMNSWNLCYMHEKNGETVRIKLGPNAVPETTKLREADRWLPTLQS